MFRVCSVALKTHEMALEDHAFRHDEIATAMYFVKLGKFKYRDNAQRLSRKTFLSEASLWTTWEHRGDLCCATEMGEIISITAEAFGNELRCHPAPWDLAFRYGHSFVEFMNRSDPAHLTDVTMNDTNIFALQTWRTGQGSMGSMGSLESEEGFQEEEDGVRRMSTAASCSSRNRNTALEEIMQRPLGSEYSSAEMEHRPH